MPINPTEDILQDLRAGKMIIMVDDEQRENEGDLILPADNVSPEAINFMTLYARGLICLTLTSAHCRRLQLPLHPKWGQPVHATNFTVSIEAACGVTTGISAADRATTVKAAIAIDAHPEDIVQPGHIFPIMAEDGGVLVRAGHTEAGCDLARLAGYQPAAVIVEILNEDGSMARRPDLEKLAAKHGLKIGTIEDLIRYRTQHEKLVERVVSTPFQSEYGEFEMIAFHDRIHRATHVALVKGPIDSSQASLVRVHVENPLSDIFAAKEVSGWPLADAMRRVAAVGQGVVVVLTEPHTGVSLLERIKHYAQPQSRGAIASGDQRAYGIGAQILADLGVKKMHLMSAPRSFLGLSAYGLEIVDYVSH